MGFARPAIVIMLGFLLLPWMAPPGAAGGAGLHPWRIETSGASQPLFDIACLSALRCKAVGAAGTIRYTRDGGRTWRPQRNPLQGTATSLSRIACVPPRTCYVLAPPATVLVTHDGGASWAARTLPVTATTPTDATCMNATTYEQRGRFNLCRSGLTGIACPNART